MSGFDAPLQPSVPGAHATRRGAFFFAGTADEKPRYDFTMHRGDGTVWVGVTLDEVGRRMGLMVDLRNRTVTHPTYGSYPLKGGVQGFTVGEPLPVDGPLGYFGRVTGVLDQSFGVDPDNDIQLTEPYHPDITFREDAALGSPREAAVAGDNFDARGFVISNADQKRVPYWALHPDGPLGSKGFTEAYLATENGNIVMVDGKTGRITDAKGQLGDGHVLQGEEWATELRVPGAPSAGRAMLLRERTTEVVVVDPTTPSRLSPGAVDVDDIRQAFHGMRRRNGLSPVGGVAAGAVEPLAQAAGVAVRTHGGPSPEAPATGPQAVADVGQQVPAGGSARRRREFHGVQDVVMDDPAKPGELYVGQMRGPGSAKQKLLGFRLAQGAQQIVMPTADGTVYRIVITGGGLPPLLTKYAPGKAAKEMRISEQSELEGGVLHIVDEHGNPTGQHTAEALAAVVVTGKVAPGQDVSGRRESKVLHFLRAAIDGVPAPSQDLVVPQPPSPQAPSAEGIAGLRGARPLPRGRGKDGGLRL